MKAIRLVVLLIAGMILAGASLNGQTANHSAQPMVGSGTYSSAAVALKQDMRKLWTDHVVWTRAYIVAAVGDQPDAQAAETRLMKNQEDIGAAVGKVYGAAAGQQLTTLLKEHIAIAGDLVKAAKAGDKTAQANHDRRWQQNASDIADFLSKANPNWPKATLVELMKMHLSTTTDEVVARLQKNWAKDAQAFDAVYTHILTMSDALSDGIIKQFPEKFGTRPIATSGNR